MMKVKIDSCWSCNWRVGATFDYFRCSFPKGTLPSPKEVTEASQSRSLPGKCPLTQLGGVLFEANNG